ncbi:hypothetical protein BT69DRAFT_71704 [Atractiella rhizophila]|nr:hypothetical protein BT69DRAFT_71704 [Atractiella rhizophila]
MDLPLVSSSLLHFTTNTASVGSLLWLLSSYARPSTVSSAQDGGGSEGGVPIALLFGVITLTAWAFSRQKDVYMAVEQKVEGVLGLIVGFLAGIGAVLSLWSLGASSEGNAAILAVEPPLLLLLSLVHSLPLPTSLSRLSLLAVALLILQIPSSLSQEAFKVFFSNFGMRVVGFGLVRWSKADGLRGRSAVVCEIAPLIFFPYSADTKLIEANEDGSMYSLSPLSVIRAAIPQQLHFSPFPP